MRALRTRLGPLDAVIVDPGERPDLLVVLAHGFGAGGDDLVGLAPELVRIEPRLARARFVFPAAPIPLGGMFGGEARAWWLIDVGRWQRAALDPTAALTWMDEVPEGMAEARRALHACVDAALTQSGLSPDRLVLAGFSQGSMLATELALRLDERPAGLAILSGAPVNGADWRARAGRRAGLPVLQTHGRVDPVLPYFAAEALGRLLDEGGLKRTFLPFDGGHEIPEAALDALAAFLAARLPA